MKYRLDQREEAREVVQQLLRVVRPGRESLLYTLKPNGADMITDFTVLSGRILEVLYVYLRHIAGWSG